MIRLTVLYNLAESVNEDQYIEWRLSSHKAYVDSMPGVLRSDFCRIDESWPYGVAPRFRFQTTVDWPDRASYEQAFLNDQAQADLRENVKKLGDHLFLVSEVLSPD
jgi:hypothetical protein